MSYIIKGQALSTPIHYVCVIQEREYLTVNRTQATKYDDLSVVLASVATLNRDKPFGRPDLTYSWQSIGFDEGTFVSSSGLLCPTCYARGEQSHAIDCPNIDDEDLIERPDWHDKNPGWSALLAFAVALALAWLYVVMMMHKPLG